ncbi:heavy-metal-associated domain-containing protein [Neisseria perflava]|uniref:heavy-metal-associated domain-containing protein n=1 Tax=Neisseria perflava TaxID=33053 RepID=UPI00209F1668|nr:heavy metal-associated domain-containing protein [Neisseria perflava]MCP1660821.1 copper chaperone [Neisseria perflava]MCP1773287.1 copper chaperone [Neisseria perflava]
MANITLNIGGMTCGGCVKSVTRILEGVDGVSSAAVSLENNSAVVEFDEGKTNPAALIEAVEDGGFDASL